MHTLRDVLSSKLLPPLLETQPKPSNLRRSDKCFACVSLRSSDLLVLCIHPGTHAARHTS